MLPLSIGGIVPAALRRASSQLEVPKRRELLRLPDADVRERVAARRPQRPCRGSGLARLLYESKFVGARIPYVMPQE